VTERRVPVLLATCAGEYPSILSDREEPFWLPKYVGWVRWLPLHTAIRYCRGELVPGLP
jgi:hypothetical protein